MSTKLKFLYACSELPSRSFICMICNDSTIEGVLQKISKKQKMKYIALFDGAFQIDNDDEIADYWEPDKVFYASTTGTPPSTEFLENVISTKKSATILPTPTTPKDEPNHKNECDDAEVQRTVAIKIPKIKTRKFKEQKVTNEVPPKTSDNSVKIQPDVKNKTPTTDVKNKTPTTDIKNKTQTTDIKNKDTVERKDEVGKYIFFFNGSNKEHLMDGIEVELDTAMNPDETRAKLLESLRDAKVDMSGKQLIVYLACGIPFIGGTLGDLYLNKEMKGKAENRIYGVITRQIADNILNKTCNQICNVSDADHKLLISPLCNSSERGLSDMACLLGYLNNYGNKADILLKACENAISFPPFLTSLNRIINFDQVVWRDVVTFSSTLFTYIRIYLPKTIEDEKVFEYALRICNLITHAFHYDGNINDFSKIEAEPGDDITKSLLNLKLGKTIFYWDGDNKNYLKFQGVEDIENAYKLIASFTPKAPLSMHFPAGYSIIRGKDHEYLFLKQSSSKDSNGQYKVDMINPMTGLIEQRGIEEFAQEQGDTKIDTSANFIDPDIVQQIIMVNFDESNHMISDLRGHDSDKNSEKDHRVAIAFQCLTVFINRIYSNQYPIIQGLVSFNNQIKVKCPLSPFVSDFEDKGLESIKPESVTRLWDSLVRSCDEIVKFRKDIKGNEIYKNAISRIIVISGGEDNYSRTSVENAVKLLIKNKIIVDSIIVGSEDECKMLCAVCHATGGISFRPETVSEKISLFGHIYFSKFEKRRFENPLIPGDRKTKAQALTERLEIITAEFMYNAGKNANFDISIPNKDFREATVGCHLSTPLRVCALNANDKIKTPRIGRILRELRLAAKVNDPSNASFYDPDMKIYTLQSNLDRWKVFLKGTKGTPYENKWWFLYVSFPDIYPVKPPVFRFISVPYHINISSDGYICLNIIDKDYISSMHVVDIIQKIKEIFFLPNLDTPVQIEAYDMLKNNPIQYEKLAKESSEQNAKDKCEDYASNSIIRNDLPKDFKLD